MISVISVTQSCLTLCNPLDCNMPASLSIVNSWNLLKLMSIKSVMVSNHFILDHPLLLLPSIFPALESFLMSQFFVSADQSVGASTSVLLMKTLPSFILYFKAKLACYSRYLLTSYFCIPVPYDGKDIFFFGVSSRRSCRCSKKHSTSAPSALVVGPRLGLLWYCLVCLGNEQRSFCHFWNCTQVPHFGLFCWVWGLLHLF